MSTKSTSSKASYTRHSPEYKQESLKLAAQIGIAKAAKQLGLHESQLCVAQTVRTGQDGQCTRIQSGR
jgi:transposase-like protein